LLLDYEEYQRLKAIEQKFNQLTSSSIRSDKASTSKSSTQEGYGLDEDAIAKIASLVTDHIRKEEAKAGHEVTLPAVKFDSQILHNDLNDSQDQKRLLKKVPKKFHASAENLLKAFEDRPNEITWDSSGINQVVRTSVIVRLCLYAEKFGKYV